MMAVYKGFNPIRRASGLSVRGMVVLGHKSDVRTVFIVRAAGFREGAAALSDGGGNVLFTGYRSWNLVTFTRSSNNTVTASRRSYDLYGNASAGAAMSTDIRNIPDGTDVCVFTYDEPSTNKTSVTGALLTLGGSLPSLNVLPFRGSYILVGRKGLSAGQGKEYQVSKGGTETRITFINGVRQ